jgi:hypothetical protein
MIVIIMNSLIVIILIKHKINFLYKQQTRWQQPKINHILLII